MLIDDLKKLKPGDKVWWEGEDGEERGAWLKVSKNTKHVLVPSCVYHQKQKGEAAVRDPPDDFVYFDAKRAAVGKSFEHLYPIGQLHIEKPPKKFYNTRIIVEVISAEPLDLCGPHDASGLSVHGELFEFRTGKKKSEQGQCIPLQLLHDIVVDPANCFGLFMDTKELTREETVEKMNFLSACNNAIVGSAPDPETFVSEYDEEE